VSAVRRSALAAALMIASALAAEAAAPPEGSWWQRAPVRTSRSYSVKTDLPRDEAQAYGRHLDRMYEEYARRLSSMAPRSPEALDVLIFARQEEYLRVLRTQFGVDATGTGGVFFATEAGTALAFWTEDLPVSRVQHVIQHEGFHQFAFSRFGSDLPMWVNEGLAEYFGSAIIVDGTLVAGQCSARQVADLSQALEGGRTIPFREMIAIDNPGWNDRLRDGRSGILYLQAWAMVHFLVEGEGGRYRGPFERYLALVNDGILAAPTWEQVFGADVEAFEARWRECALALKPAAFLTALERLDFLAYGLLELSRRGEQPASLDAARDALRRIGFKTTIERHGQSIVVDAADDASFAIPMDDQCRDQPVFVVEAPPRRRLNPREAVAEATNPTPSSVRTENLRPKDLLVRWRRDREGGAPRLDLELVKPA
jgi:hypothetical protein